LQVSQRFPLHLVVQKNPKRLKMEHRESAQEKTFRKVFGWVVLIGTSAWGLFAGSFLAYQSMRPNSWLVDLIQKHFAALMCVPMAALMSMCVVILLRYAAGPIEFKVPGFEFQGASGQVVLWVMCFLAIVSAIKLLW
jgi:hypothetical protein